MEPLIGITCGQDQERFGVTRFYSEAVAAAGGIPVMLAITAERKIMTAYVKRLDGLVLTGGEDLDPGLFEEEPMRGLGVVSPARDQFELAVCRGFIDDEKPVLGICRGMQVLNISQGGSLFQDLASQLPKSLQHEQLGPRNRLTHGVKIIYDSLLREILKVSSLRVNSFHHQAVKLIPEGYQPVAWSADGVVEAIEKMKGFAVGVQWHPERLWAEEEAQRRLFTEFVGACKTKTAF